MTTREDQPNSKSKKPQTPIEHDPTAYAKQRLMKRVSELSGLPSGIGRMDGMIPKRTPGSKPEEATTPAPSTFEAQVLASLHVSTPCAVYAAGRSKNGKSFGVEFLIDRLVEAGKPPMICDCDRDNASLTERYGEKRTFRPQLASYAYFDLYLKQMLSEQSKKGLDAFFDMGFGRMWDFCNFAEKNSYKDVLVESNIRPVLLLFLSHNLDDLMPVDNITKVFLPDDVIIVLNEACLEAEDDFEIAYRPIMADPRIKNLLEHGAHTLHMPRMPGGQKFHNTKQPFSRATRNDWANPLDIFERRGAAKFYKTFADACDELKGILPCP